MYQGEQNQLYWELGASAPLFLLFKTLFQFSHARLPDLRPLPVGYSQLLEGLGSSLITQDLERLVSGALWRTEV